MSSRRGSSHFRKVFRGGRGDGGGRGDRGGRGDFGGRGGRGGRGGWRGKTKTVKAGSLLPTDGISNDEKFESARLANQIDEAMGFPRYESGPKKVGWLVNMHTVCIPSFRGMPWDRWSHAQGQCLCGCLYRHCWKTKTIQEAKPRWITTFWTTLGGHSKQHCPMTHTL